MAAKYALHICCILRKESIFSSIAIDRSNKFITSIYIKTVVQMCVFPASLPARANCVGGGPEIEWKDDE